MIKDGLDVDVPEETEIRVIMEEERIPHRQTFVQLGRCDVCETIGEEEDIQWQWAFPHAFQRQGWRYCRVCQPVMEDHVIPKWFESEGLLPPENLAPLLTKSLRFQRISIQRPERSGTYDCRLSEDHPILRLQKDGTILLFVEWKESDMDPDSALCSYKSVPLSKVIVSSRDRWPTSSAFLKELNIVPGRKGMTHRQVEAWTDAVHNLYESVFSVPSHQV